MAQRVSPRLLSRTRNGCPLKFLPLPPGAIRIAAAKIGLHFDIPRRMALFRTKI